MNQEELKQRLIELIAKARASMRKESGLNCDFARNCYFAEFLIANGVTIRERGEWIVHEDDWCGTYYTCSACKCDWTTIDGTPQENNMRYCPHCGADMRGVTKTPETEKGGAE